jgi:hypothetical protein
MMPSFKRARKFYVLLIVLLFLGFGAVITHQAKRAVDKNKEQSSPLFLPADFSFAGEPVPVQSKVVQQRLQSELMEDRFWTQQIPLFWRRSQVWFPILEPILKKAGIPNDFKYLAIVESGLVNARSRSGAEGFWQFMPITAQKYGLEISATIDERRNPELATYAAVRYFKEAYDTLHSWTLVAASFNTGINGLIRKVAEHPDQSYYELDLGHQAGEYIYRTLAIKAIMEHPDKYGVDKKGFPSLEFGGSRKVKIDTVIESISHLALEMDADPRVIRLFNPWWLADPMPASKQKPRYLSIPIRHADEYSFWIGNFGLLFENFAANAVKENSEPEANPGQDPKGDSLRREDEKGVRDPG